MAPYIGLIDTRGIEVSANGYRRLDLSDVVFKVSPAREQRNHLVFVNSTSIKWRAKAQWPDCPTVAIYDDVDACAPLFSAPLKSLISNVEYDDQVVIFPGMLSFATHLYSR